MRVLVTGGAGFIGANFVLRTCVERPDVHVSVLDAMTYAASRRTIDRFPSQVSVVEGDIRNEGLVDRLVASSDLVVHCAAESHNDNALVTPGVFVQTNLLGTYVVLEAVRRHGVRLHHVSTDEVYGSLDLDDPSRFEAGRAYDPSSPYSATKAGSDLLVRAWVRSFGVAATISISSNNYGPWQHVEKFIPRQVTNLIDGLRPQVYGSGRNVRDWLHVEDHVAAIWRIIDRGENGQTYLVGAECECSNLDVVRELLAIFGREPNDFDLVADRPGHDLRYAIDPSRLRGELGWRPIHTDLRVGLAETVQWYRDNESWWRPVKAATEAIYRTRGQG